MLSCKEGKYKRNRGQNRIKAEDIKYKQGRNIKDGHPNFGKLKNGTGEQE